MQELDNTAPFPGHCQADGNEHLALVTLMSPVQDGLYLNYFCFFSCSMGRYDDALSNFISV